MSTCCSAFRPTRRQGVAQGAARARLVIPAPIEHGNAVRKFRQAAWPGAGAEI